MKFQVMICTMNVNGFANKLREFGVCSRANESVLLQHLNPIPLRYEPSSLNYQREYWLGSRYEELMEVATNSERVYWPLIITSENSTEKISSDGRYLFPPIFLGSKTSQSSYQRIQLNCLSLIQELARNYEIGQVEIRSDFQSQAHPWYEFAINSGIKISSSFEDVLNLGVRNEQIFSELKDSTRRDIVKGLDHFDLEILDGEHGANNLEKFRELHVIVSGRVTRDSVTWDIQRQNLLNDRGLLILCRERNKNELISGSYFEFNKSEANYGVSATKREYFKTPVNHAMQWKAIEYFNSRNISYYRLGKRYSSSAADLKLQNISKFKRKFASHFESIFTFEIGTKVRL